MGTPKETNAVKFINKYFNHPDDEDGPVSAHLVLEQGDSVAGSLRSLTLSSMVSK